MSDGGPWAEISSAIVAAATALAGVFGWNKYRSRPEPEKPATSSGTHSKSAHTVRIETARERQHEMVARLEKLEAKIDHIEQIIAKIPGMEDRTERLFELVKDMFDTLTLIRSDIAVLKDRSERA